MTSERLVLFGGSFDPVHHGHLIVARAVGEHLAALRVVLVPARQSPHKQRIFASAEDRLAMLRLATSGQTMLEASDVEIIRDTPSYTIDTLEHFARLHEGPIAWVIGADMLHDLPCWHRARELVERFELVIAGRPAPPEQLEAAMRNIQRVSGGANRPAPLRGHRSQSPH